MSVTVLAHLPAERGQGGILLFALDFQGGSSKIERITQDFWGRNHADK